MYATETVKLA